MKKTKTKQPGTNQFNSLRREMVANLTVEEMVNILGAARPPERTGKSREWQDAHPITQAEYAEWIRRAYAMAEQAILHKCDRQ